MKDQAHKFCPSLRDFTYNSNVVIKGTHFVMKCPMYNSLGVRFPSSFHNLVLLGNLEAFSQVNHQVGKVLAHVPNHVPSNNR